MHLLAGCGQLVLARFSNDTLPYPLSSYKRSVLGFRTSLVAVGTLVNPAPPAQIRTGSITAYGSYLGYLASKRCFTHIEQVARRAGPALRPGRGRLPDVLLGRSPSLYTLRRWLSTVVRALRRYYATVRLPIDVRVGLLAQGLLQPARHTFHDGRRWGLPVLARGVSIHAWGLRLRGVRRMLAIAHPSVLPSAMRNDVGTPVAIISQLNTQPACAPVNASPTALQLPTHDSGSGWLATPFLCDSFIHNSTPVYPGALRILLEAIGADAYRVVRVRKTDEDKAIALIRAHRDKLYSLCDALSFVVMERLRIREAISFDQDFRSYGRFAVLS